MNRNIVIGLGQGGSRLANALSSIADDTLAINSNAIDMSEINNKISPLLLKGEDGKAVGVGGDYIAGERLFRANREVITEFLGAKIEKGDFVWVCASLGGGTGSGGASIIAGVIKKLKAFDTLVLIVAAESEGINRGYNSIKRLGIIYEKCCVNAHKANILLLDNSKFENHARANSALFTSVRPMFRPGKYELGKGSVGHADEADLRTALRTQCGCIICGPRDRIRNASFLGHEYVLEPTSIWVRDLDNGRNESEIKEFLSTNQAAFIFHGEYSSDRSGLEMFMGGLQIPFSLRENKRLLVGNVHTYTVKKEGASKRRDARKYNLKFKLS